MLKKLIAVSAIGLAIAMAPTHPALAKDELKLHIFIPPVANPVKTFLNPWIQKVKKDSGGDCIVTLYPSMQLGGHPPQLTDQVKDGIVDIVWTLPSYNTGRYPIFEVFELPLVETNSLATTLAMQDFAPKYLKDEFKDFHVILFHVHDGVLLMSKKPIRKASDMRGLKIRILNQSQAWFFGALGAHPLGAPLPEIPQMLAKGVIDATTLPYEIAPAVKMQELVSHFSIMAGKRPRFAAGGFAFLMNKESYRKLSPQSKDAIDKNSGRYIADWAGRNWEDIEIPGKKVMMSKKKNQFHVIPPKEVKKFEAAAKGAIKRWIAGMNKKGYKGQEIYDTATKLVDKYTN